MPKTSVIVSGAHTGSQRWKRATLPGGRPPPGFGAKPAGIHLASSADPPTSDLPGATPPAVLPVHPASTRILEPSP